MKTFHWTIEGMRCAGCARTIEARLVREPGVIQAEVAHTSGTARLLVDPQVAHLDALVGLLEQAGYRIDTQPDPHQQGDRHEPGRHHRS